MVIAVSSSGVTGSKPLIKGIRRPIRPQQKNPLVRYRNLPLICNNIPTQQKIHLFRHPKPTRHSLRIRLILMTPMFNQPIMNARNHQPRHYIQSKMCLAIRWQKIRQLRDDQVCFGAALKHSAWDAVAGLGWQSRQMEVLGDVSR